jgi:hypothetical protein
MTNETGCLVAQTVADADALMARVCESADYVQEWLIGQTGDPLAKLRAMRFELATIFQWMTPTWRVPMAGR